MGGLLSSGSRTSRSSEHRLIESIVKNGEKIRRRKIAGARKAEKRAKGTASQRKGCRALSTEEIGLATWIFVRAFRHGVRVPYPVDRREIEDDRALDALVPSNARKAKWLNDATYDLRMAVPMWGEVQSGSVRMELSYIKTEELHNNDVACIESFHGHGVRIDAVSGTTSLEELNQLAGGSPDILSEIVYRWHRREQAKRAVAGLLGGAILMGCALTAPKIIRWVKSLSRIEHIQPAPPKPLGSGVVIESCELPTEAPTRERATEGASDMGDEVLLWNTAGTLTLARSTERWQYLRDMPDSDLSWTWTIGIDGVDSSYETTGAAVRLTGAAGMRITYRAGWKWAEVTKISLHGSGTETVGEGHYPVGTTPVTDGRITVVKAGVSVPEQSPLLVARETWRAPLLRYDCDASLTCTFTLAPGPWHPCWERVEVAFGDGAVIDTRSAPAGILDAITWPRFLPLDERWLGYTDTWDRMRLRARHQYATAGTYSLAFWLSRADPGGFSGPCEPGPPTWTREQWRRFERLVEIVPGARGKYPPNAGS